MLKHSNILRTVTVDLPKLDHNARLTVQLIDQRNASAQDINSRRNDLKVIEIPKSVARAVDAGLFTDLLKHVVEPSTQPFLGLSRVKSHAV